MITDANMPACSRTGMMTRTGSLIAPPRLGRVVGK